MKKLDKLILAIFSIIILIESIILCVVIAGWIDVGTVTKIFTNMVIGERNVVLLIIAIVCALLSIKAIFFSSSEKNKLDGQGVLMQNDNGKLMISRATLVNLVEAVIKDFSSVNLAGTKIELDAENHVIVDINIVVSKDVIIKDLTVNIQNKIKQAIKKTSDLEVKEVNVRIKNIEEPNSTNENKIK